MSGRERTMVLGLVFAAALSGSVAWLASIGSLDAAAGLGAVVLRWLGGGGLALGWALGAIGLGVAVCRAMRLGGCGVGLPAAVGLSAMLWLDHALGALGWPGGFTAGVGLPLVGLAVLGLGCWRRRRGFGAAVESAASVSPVLFACVPGLAALAVASCVPPGTLWGVEGNGYDTLSYHLALPRMWAAQGGLSPLESNAYSWLPSYMESAYLHLAVVARVDAQRVSSMWVESCQCLHALLVVAAAVCIGSLTKRLMAPGEPGAMLGAGVAAAVVISTPWSLITGSLAYNEMGMLVGMAGALMLARPIEAADRAIARGMLCGLCLGVSVACKPTAAILGAPLIVIAALSWNPRAARFRVIVGVLIGGLAASAPWLIRNWLVAGNPVFPYFDSWFGGGHWTNDQHARWDAAHHAQRSIVESLLRVFSGDGALHPAWSLVFPMAAAGAAWAAVKRPGAGRVLAVGLVVQVGAWAFVGHQQPRFLLACLVSAAPLIGMLAGGLYRGTWRRAVLATAAAWIAWVSFTGALRFSRENQGSPCRALSIGVDGVAGNGGADARALLAMPREELAAALESAGNPVAAANLWLRRLRAEGESPMLYLLGDAGALYHDAPLLWNTAWDAWPLENARRERPDDPESWGRSLRVLGVTHVLVNLAEVHRLRESGYSPEAMTPELCARFVHAACAPVVEWPERGVGLYRLNETAGSADSRSP